MTTIIITPKPTTIKPMSTNAMSVLYSRLIRALLMAMALLQGLLACIWLTGDGHPTKTRTYTTASGALITSTTAINTLNSVSHASTTMNAAVWMAFALSMATLVGLLRTPPRYLLLSLIHVIYFVSMTI